MKGVEFQPTDLRGCLIEGDVSPEIQRALSKEHIVIAHSLREVYRKRAGIDDCSPTVGIAAWELEDILKMWRGQETQWATLKGARVLDLACGSAYSSYYAGVGKETLTFYPHFARLCAINGATVTAIDYYYQDGFDKTLFEWDVLDITEAVLQGNLPDIHILQGRKFDIIHSSQFIGHNPCPRLQTQLDNSGVKMEDFEKALITQAGELLAEGGIMRLGTVVKEQTTLPNFQGESMPVYYHNREGRIYAQACSMR